MSELVLSQAGPPEHPSAQKSSHWCHMLRCGSNDNLKQPQMCRGMQRLSPGGLCSSLPRPLLWYTHVHPVLQEQKNKNHKNNHELAASSSHLISVKTTPNNQQQQQLPQPPPQPRPHHCHCHIRQSDRPISSNPARSVIESSMNFYLFFLLNSPEAEDVSIGLKTSLCSSMFIIC